VDVGTGVLLYNSDFYIGAAAHHLNQPDLSLTGSVARLPMKLDVHTGYRFPFKKQRGFARRRGADHSFTPVIHYKRQQNTQQLDVGSYVNYEPAVFGLWYRGVPFSKAPDKTLQQDAIVILAGVRAPTDYGLIKFGLSYDFPVSRGATNFGRTFEVSLAYQFIDERCRKRISYKHIPCPGI
jgi:type IX secretion system PorP/SprF family membrane protein